MRLTLVLLLLAAIGLADVNAAEPPLLVRAQNLTVTPSTGPVTHVVVKNCQPVAYQGTLRVEFPEGWKVTPSQHALVLAPGETKTLPFTIERGSDRQANAYPLRIHADGSGGSVTVDQTAVCASAPYFKPAIDGKLDEWKDALPMTLVTGGLKTVVRAYWSSKQFSLAVEVEGPGPRGGEKAAAPQPEAIQFSLAAAGAAVVDRYEFLVAAPGDASSTRGECYALREPGDDAAAIAKPRRLGELPAAGGQAVVVRSGRWTVYEVCLPLKKMPAIRPAPGREITFSLLAHVPGEPAPRDLGDLMNRWPEHRRPQGWCSWEGVRWGGTVPFDSQAEFGFCSSIH